MTTERSNYWPFDDFASERRFWQLMRLLSESPDGGVAFFGAGASYDAGFPTWQNFHEEFLQHFGAQPAADPRNEVRTMLNDFDYHIDRCPTEALSLVKERFATATPQVTRIVRLALDARSLRHFFTTNFDDILFEAASNESVAVYPTYIPRDSRFVYLHGRAATAESVHDHLVLGTHGYQIAYDDSYDGRARSKVRELASYPVIFIGFSMADLAVEKSISEIANAARYRRRLRLHNGEDDEEIVPLDFYILLIAPDKTDPLRNEEKDSKERWLNQIGVKVIWYQYGGDVEPHRAINEVVQRIGRESRGLTVSERRPELVEQLLYIEELASIALPTASQVGRARTLVDGHARVASEFFNRVEGIAWFRALRDTGGLDPRPSTTTEGGVRRASSWQAVPFLQKMTLEAPYELGEFLCDVQTDNWIAIRQILTLLDHLDESVGETLGIHFTELAIRAMDIDHRLLIEIFRTAHRLELAGKERVSFAIVATAVFKLAEINPPIPEAALSAPLSRIMAQILARSSSGIRIPIEALDFALSQRYGSADEDDLRYYRPAIEPHRMNRLELSTVGLLIDVTRDTLLNTENNVWRSDTVQELLSSQWPTKRRIGIAHCFQRPEDLAMHETSIIDSENLENVHLFHELAQIVSTSMDNLSNQSVEVLTSFMESLHQGEAPEERYAYELWAAILPSDLLPTPLDMEVADDESRLFRDFYIGPFHRVSAPIDYSDFSSRVETLNSEEIIDLVRDPYSSGIRMSIEHSPTQMWGLLAEYAKENEDLDLLLNVGPEDLLRDSTWSVIEAIPAVAGNSLESWSAVLEWARTMCSNLDSVQLGPIGEIVARCGKESPLELSEQVRELAISIIGATKRMYLAESDLYPDYLLSGFINYPSGKATHALFELFNREIAEQDAQGRGEVESPSWLSDYVLEPIARDPMAMGIDAWIAIGRYYALLLARNPEASAFVAPVISSDSARFQLPTVSFWSGYLWAPVVWSDALRELREAYYTTAARMQVERAIEQDLKDRFYQHIVIGAQRGIYGYDRILLSTLGDEFTSETRGSIAIALGFALQEAAEDSRSEGMSTPNYWLVSYWSEQVFRLGGQDGIQLAKYLRWLRYVESPPSEITAPIETSLAQARDSFDVDEVFAYIERYANQEPDTVLTLLDRCVEWYRLHGDFWLDGDRVRSLLYQINETSVDQTTLREVVNGFTELGAISIDELRSLLNGETA